MQTGAVQRRDAIVQMPPQVVPTVRTAPAAGFVSLRDTIHLAPKGIGALTSLSDPEEAEHW